MKIHEKIRFLREAKGWSQDDMADKLDMSLNGYASIERGETDVQVSKLEKIAEVLGIELLDLLSIGERNVFYLASNHNQLSIHFYGHWRYNKHAVFSDDSDNQKELQRKLEQQEKEIAYLKQLIESIKK